MQSTLLTNHVRRHCGEPNDAWEFQKYNVYVGRYDDVPVEGISSFVTAGLSSHVLFQPRSGKKIRQELVASSIEKFRTAALPNLLFATAEMVIETHKPLLRGQVIWPLASLFPEYGGSCIGIYCGPPGYFSDEFIVFDSNPDVVFVELYPVTEDECRFVEKHGYEKFEDSMEEGRVQILDFSR